MKKFQSQSRSGRGWYCNCLLPIVLVLVSVEVCSAVHHVVGEDRGWDPFSPFDFNAWASRNIFRVGDNLWFAYSSAELSVVELSSVEEWEACNISNPIRMYNGGLDSVPLIQVGSRYFTSGRMEDCQNGMKLHINVVSDADGFAMLHLNTTNTVAVKSSLAAEGPTSGSPISGFTSILSGSCLLVALLCLIPLLHLRL